MTRRGSRMAGCVTVLPAMAAKVTKGGPDAPLEPLEDDGDRHGPGDRDGCDPRTRRGELEQRGQVSGLPGLPGVRARACGVRARACGVRARARSGSRAPRR